MKLNFENYNLSYYPGINKTKKPSDLNFIFLEKVTLGAGEMVQSVKDLPWRHEDLTLDPQSAHKTQIGAWSPVVERKE